MSLPKFNLDKLRESVSQQQAITRKDMANLFLLDRLQAQISREKGEYKGKDINLPELNEGTIRVFLEFKSNDGLPIRHIDLKVLRYPDGNTSVEDWYKKYNSYFSEKVSYVETPLDILFQNYDPVVEASDLNIHQYNFWEKIVTGFEQDEILHMRESDPTQIFLRVEEDRVYAIYDIDFPENQYHRYLDFYKEEWSSHLFNDVNSDLQKIVTDDNIVNAADNNMITDSRLEFEALFANLDMIIQKIQINTGEKIEEIT